MGGFSSITGDETIMFADNVSFNGNYRSGKLTTDGELLIGSTAAPHIRKGTLTSTDGSVTIIPGSGTIDLSSSPVNVPQDQIYYVGKHGNDANSGLNVEQAKLTFGSAITAATALTPTAINRFVVECFDDGIYTEDLTCVSFVDINAQNAKLVGAIAAVDDVNVRFRAQDVVDATIGVLKSAGTGSFFVDIDEVSCAGSGVWILNLSGIIQAKWKKCTIVDGFAIGDITSAQAHVHILGGDIYITGTGIGIARDNNGSTVGHVDHIIDQGTGVGTGFLLENGTFDITVSQTSALAEAIHVDGGVANLSINEVSSTTAYNVTGGTLNLIFNSMTGARTTTGGTVNTSTVHDYGVAGQVFTSNGAGVDPTFQTLSPIFVWSDIGASGALVVNQGFIANAGAALSFSLPATSAVGDVIALALDGATSWVISQGANQQIRMGSITTTLGVGGSLASTSQGDSITLVCKTANLLWTAVYGSFGNISHV